jgi:hypothetical protein
VNELKAIAKLKGVPRQYPEDLRINARRIHGIPFDGCTIVPELLEQNRLNIWVGTPVTDEIHSLLPQRDREGRAARWRER